MLPATTTCPLEATTAEIVELPTLKTALWAGVEVAAAGALGCAGDADALGPALAGSAELGCCCIVEAWAAFVEVPCEMMEAMMPAAGVLLLGLAAAGCVLCGVLSALVDVRDRPMTLAMIPPTSVEAEDGVFGLGTLGDEPGVELPATGVLGAVEEGVFAGGVFAAGLLVDFVDKVDGSLTGSAVNEDDELGGTDVCEGPEAAVELGAAGELVSALLVVVYATGAGVEGPATLLSLEHAIGGSQIPSPSTPSWQLVPFHCGLKFDICRKMDGKARPGAYAAVAIGIQSFLLNQQLACPNQALAGTGLGGKSA